MPAMKGCPMPRSRHHATVSLLAVLLAVAGTAACGAPPADDAPARVATALTCNNPLITYDQVYAAVLADLATSDFATRRNYRYLDLTNRYNAGACDADLALDRKAMNKLLNGLSTVAAMAMPVPINASNTIYRIDMRRYGWARTVNVLGRNYLNGWEAIIASSPFAVELEGPDANRAKSMASTRVPVLALDALTDPTTHGAVYYALLGIPSTRSAFLAGLGLPTGAPYQLGSSIRIGTTTTIVHPTDFVAQRDPIPAAPSRVYWEAFRIVGSVFQTPLGFSASESEALFTLSNGLQGYAAFNSAGGLVNGGSQFMPDVLSCMKCHAQGAASVTDQVRAIVAANSREIGLTADEVQAVLALYVPSSAANTTIQQDRASYANALGAAQVLATDPEPISRTFETFNQGVTAAVAAADLHVTTSTLLGNLNALDPILTVLTREPLDRPDWASVYHSTLCALSTGVNRPRAASCP
jgi:hypothetical protein